MDVERNTLYEVGIYQAVDASLTIPKATSERRKYSAYEQGKGENMMTAYIQSDPRSLLLEKRKQYEDEVAQALLDEDAEEREERLNMVRACQPMAVAVLHMPVYEPAKYGEDYYEK